MTTPPPGQPPSRFRITLAKVIAVQVVSLLALWLLQAAYTH